MLGWVFGYSPVFDDDTVTFVLTPGNIAFGVDGKGLPETSQNLDIKFVTSEVTVPTSSGTKTVTPASIKYGSETISTAPTKIDY